MHDHFGQFKINATLFLHIVWVMLIYFTWPFIFTHPAFNAFFYFPLVAITLALRTILKGDCWLTTVENNFRRKYDPATVYSDTDKCLPYYSGKWFKFRIEKPVIVSAFSFCFLLSLFILLKNIFL